MSELGRTTYYEISAQHNKQTVLQGIRAQYEPAVSTHTIADHVGLSVSFVQDWCRRLEDEGVLSSAELHATRGRKRYYWEVDSDE